MVLSCTVFEIWRLIG